MAGYEMSEKHRAILKDPEVRKILLRDLSAILIAEKMTHIFNMDDRDEIRAEITGTSKVTKFLDLLEKKGPKAFDAFKSQLEVDQQKHLYKLLCDAEEGKFSAGSSQGVKDDEGTPIQEESTSSVKQQSASKLSPDDINKIEQFSGEFIEKLNVQGTIEDLVKENLLGLEARGIIEENEEREVQVRKLLDFLKDSDHMKFQAFRKSLGKRQPALMHDFDTNNSQKQSLQDQPRCSDQGNKTTDNNNQGKPSCVRSESHEEYQKNCIMWPESQQWGNEWKVKIERNADKKFGFTVHFCEPGKSVYYIVKTVEEDGPSSAHLTPGDWVVAVNDTPTTTMNKKIKFQELITGCGDKAVLTIRSPVNHFQSIRQWYKQEVDISYSTFSETEFAHYFVMGEDGKPEDRLRVVKQTRDRKHRLEKGDYLFSIGGVQIKGMKLIDAHKMVKENKKVTVMKMVKGIKWENMLANTALEKPQSVYWNEQEIVVKKANGSTIKLSSLKAEGGTFYHVVNTQPNRRSTVYKHGIQRGYRLVRINDQDVTSCEGVEVANLLQNATELTFVAPKGLKEHTQAEESSESEYTTASSGTSGVEGDDEESQKTSSSDNEGSISMPRTRSVHMSMSSDCDFQNDAYRASGEDF